MDLFPASLQFKLMIFIGLDETFDRPGIHVIKRYYALHGMNYQIHPTFFPSNFHKSLMYSVTKKSKKANSVFQIAMQLVQKLNNSQKDQKRKVSYNAPNSPLF